MSVYIFLLCIIDDVDFQFLKFVDYRIVSMCYLSRFRKEIDYHYLRNVDILYNKRLASARGLDERARESRDD